MIREYLKQHVLIADGAMGTYYAKQQQEDGAISELACLTYPERIEQIHREYILAGAKMIRTNTFAANTHTLNISESKQIELIKKACQIAKKAIVNAEQEVFIAGDIGPISLNAGSDYDEILKEYKRMCDVFLEEKVDVILFETFPDLTYIKEVVSYIRQKSDVFLMASFCLNKNGYTMNGVSANRIVSLASEMEELDGFGFNCGIGSGHMLQILKEIEFPKQKYISIMPNAGYPEQLQNRMVFLDNTEYFVNNLIDIESVGVQVVGGCCGTTPKYIRALSQKLPTSPMTLHVNSMESREKQEVQSDVKKNDFYELFQQGKKVVAVELDPPYDANYEKLIEQAQAVKQSGADIITFADSPMGRSRVDSILMSIKVANEVHLPVMPHVCCRDKNMIAMRSSLLGAYIHNIRNLLIVTGDPVPSVSRVNTSSVFDYNSFQLMDFVQEMNQEHFSNDPIVFGGALNYGRGKIEKVIERMEKKIVAGASYFLTQPVYCDEDIERLRFIRRKLDTKLLCGIMPFVSYRNANFIKNEMSGIFVPDEIVNRYSPDMSKEEAELIGAEIANEIIAKTSDFADGYYIMLPFNRVSLLNKLNI